MTLEITELNHVALHVKDVEKSVLFYKNILELEQLHTRPNFDFNGAWFRLGTYQELHIIEGRDYEVNSHSRKSHFALKVNSAEKTVAFLKSKQVQMVGPKPRPNGAIQIFITDPDGYWIELTEIN